MQLIWEKITVSYWSGQISWKVWDCKASCKNLLHLVYDSHWEKLKPHIVLVRWGWGRNCFKLQSWGLVPFKPLPCFQQRGCCPAGSGVQGSTSRAHEMGRGSAASHGHTTPWAHWEGWCRAGRQGPGGHQQPGMILSSLPALTCGVQGCLQVWLLWKTRTWFLNSQLGFWLYCRYNWSLWNDLSQA